MHRTYTSKTDEVSELRRRSEHSIPPLTKKLFAVGICWHLRKSVFSIRVYINWVYQPHLRIGPRSKVVGGRKMKSVFIWFCGGFYFVSFILRFIHLSYLFCLCFDCCFVLFHWKRERKNIKLVGSDVRRICVKLVEENWPNYIKLNFVLNWKLCSYFPIYLQKTSCYIKCRLLD